MGFGNHASASNIGVVRTYVDGLLSAIGQGPATYYTHTQAAPLATWTIPNTFGRLPCVQVYVNGAQVDTDIDASLPQVVITFPIPTSGVAVLS
jgi:hypothetical protein